MNDAQITIANLLKAIHYGEIILRVRNGKVVVIEKKETIKVN